MQTILTLTVHELDVGIETADTEMVKTVVDII